MKYHRHSKLHISVLIIITIFLLTGCKSENKKQITTLEQLNSPEIKIGVSEGTAENQLVEKVFPNAQIVYFKTSPSAFEAVSKGEVDAFVYEKQEMEIAIRNGLKGTRLLDDVLGEGNKVAAGLSPVSQIPDLEDKINAFIDEIKTNGVMDDLNERWIINGDYTMPEIEKPQSPSLHLKVGTTGLVKPYSYFDDDNNLSGRDIELAYRFAAWLGAEIEFKVYDFGSIIEAVQKGEVDCIISDIYITEERQKLISFSKPYWNVEVGVLVHDE
ncbi:MAG: transporter substrate-binding domain-containing protein [Erysipelotrichaceae bacterium]|nr:transporter substrate-binding domain-containing protein [Erysipelotrichaceae bacterium]